ncbi:MAG: carboxypeptidase-like regulatory domain-containing protein [Bacteroidales bacterium]|nr:carboxypeptidase-like regulatory domain-containing protein [Bacteroidales bacterium]MCF8332901.1 carboxypeptidase-like regulatory domain-containing protein [Bacteroidales bacterium]
MERSPVQYIAIIFYVLALMDAHAQNESGDTTFIFKGKVVNARKMEGIYNAHIVNTTKNIGAVSFFDGSFKIHTSPSDSLKISLVGYQTKTLEVTNSHRNLQVPVIIPLKFRPLSMERVTIYGKTYEQFKRDFVQLDIKPIPVNTEALKSIDEELDLLGPASPSGFKGPIQMLYDRFNENERLRRKILRNRRKHGNPEAYEGFPVYPSNIGKDTIPSNDSQ